MRIRVTPNAKRDEAFVRGGVLCVKVSCPAQDNKANRRAVEILEKELGCKVMIMAGNKSRDKEIQIGCAEEDAAEKIARLEKR